MASLTWVHGIAPAVLANGPEPIPASKVTDYSPSGSWIRGCSGMSDYPQDMPDWLCGIYEANDTQIKDSNPSIHIAFIGMICVFLGWIDDA